MKSCMIVIYFIIMVMMVYASEKDESKWKEEWKVKENSVTIFSVFRIESSFPRKTKTKRCFFLFFIDMENTKFDKKY